MNDCLPDNKLGESKDWFTIPPSMPSTWALYMVGIS